MSGQSPTTAQRWSAASPWPSIPEAYTGGVCASDVASHDVNGLVASLVDVTRGEAFLAWQRYQVAAELHARLVIPDPHDVFLNDQFAQCASRVAVTLAIGRAAAEKTLREAVALRHRLPAVSQRLRDGLITPSNAATIVARTDLVDGRPWAGEVDVEIAAAVDRDPGGWSLHTTRDMVDRIIFRHDPDSVRERRQRALDDRAVRVSPAVDGMANVRISMSAENAELAQAANDALARSVCELDSRTLDQRRSDAGFARLIGAEFGCDCGSDSCTAVGAATGAEAEARVVIHVVCDQATLDGTAHNAGFMAGHGVITDVQVRDLAARPDARIAPIVPSGTPMQPDGTFVLPAHLPSDPYRPSTALDAFVRARDGYSVVPGNATSAWRADLDHVREYDHTDPSAGGQTLPDNLNAKDRRNHLIKTHGHWVDDQWRDENGVLRQEFTTPEGLRIRGGVENLEALFPGLRRIRFEAPAKAPPHPTRTVTPPPEPDEPRRSQTRVAAKHARRQAERERNRQRRQALDVTTS